MYTVKLPYRIGRINGAQNATAFVISSAFSKKFFYLKHYRSGKSIYPSRRPSFDSDQMHNPNFHELSQYLDEVFSRGYIPTMHMFSQLTDEYMEEGVVNVTSIIQLDSLRLSAMKKYDLTNFHGGTNEIVTFNQYLMNGFDLASQYLPFNNKRMVSIYYNPSVAKFDFFLISPDLLGGDGIGFCGNGYTYLSDYPSVKAYHAVYNFQHLTY